MSDWFKLYEGEINEPKMRWAMSEQQQTFVVYIALACSCCQAKSDTIPWSGEDVDYMGLAASVGISVPIANQCVQLLIRIRYVQIQDGFLKMLNWNNRQSDYCRRKSDTVRTVSAQCPNTIRTKTEVSPLLSSPLISSEGGTGGNQVELPRGFPTTVDDAVVQGEFIGADPVFCTTVWNKAMSRGGLDAKGVPITSFRHYLSTELAYDRERQAKAKNGHNGVSRNGADTVVLNSEYERVLDRMKVIRSQYCDHQTWDKKDVDEFNSLKSRKKELKSLLGITI